jgi:hypothetical protein
MWRRFESCGTLSRISFLALAFALGSPTVSAACGYHDDVALARGLLNWTYPDALHVLGAIASATAERRLSAPEPAAPVRDLFGGGYRQTVGSIERLAAALRNASVDRSSRSAFAVVLVEPMLWTRFEASEDRDLNARIHVSGPERGDLVVVSGEVVVAAIADGRLTVGEAQRAGLIRLYGSDDQIAWFLATFQDVGRIASTKPAEGRTHSIDGGAVQQRAP